MQTESGRGRPLWTEGPTGRPRMPDPVRASAVRAGLLASLTLIEAMIATLVTLARTWLAAPALLSAVVSAIVTVWAVLDVLIAWQVWHQRHGVGMVINSAHGEPAPRVSVGQLRPAEPREVQEGPHRVQSVR